MKTISACNGRIVVNGTLRDRACFSIENGIIAGVSDGDAPRSGAAFDLQGGWLVPGFVDTQVNGGGGVLFNDAPTPETIARIGRAHAAYGTTAFLPTLISDDLEMVARALDAVDAAIDAGVPGCIGIHVEGPFLNFHRRGIHDPRFFRPLDDEAVALICQARRGVVMVTLAPECNAPSLVRRLVDAGVIVSLGHSDADYATARDAIAAGARGATHLFNAMAPFGHREPGLTGAVLEDETLFAGLIADGIHVHRAAICVAMAARPKSRMMLVTDAMPSVGTRNGSFSLNGQTITVKDGACQSEDGTLAGCHLDMATAVRNMVDWGTPECDAFALASANPAAFVRRDDRIGALSIGRRADMVWLDAALYPRGTWIGGKRCA